MGHMGGPRPPIIERTDPFPDVLPARAAAGGRGATAPTLPVPHRSPSPSRGRRTGFLQPAVVVISMVLIAGGVWWLLRH